MKKIEKIKQVIFTKEMRILPGSLAYSFFLAIIPILTLIFYFCTTFHLPMDIINDFLTETFPTGVVDLLQPILTDSISINNVITIVVGIFVAASGCNSMIIASNTIYNIDDSPYFRRMIKAVVITFSMIILFAFIVVVQLLGETILALTLRFLTLNDSFISIIYLILKIPVSLIVIFLFIKFIYSIAPDERIPSKYMSSGAMFTSIMWLILTFAFSYYVNNVANYSLVYGNLANIVILLLWFFALAYIFVLGLNINKIKYDEGIEKTNTIKLDEIRKKINDNKNK